MTTGSSFSLMMMVGIALGMVRDEIVEGSKVEA